MLVNLNLGMRKQLLHKKKTNHVKQNGKTNVDDVETNHLKNKYRVASSGKKAARASDENKRS